MKINGQTFEVTSKYLVLRLHDPFWSAWQRFGWEEGVPGYSVNATALEKATELKKKILVKNKYGDYEITPSKALEYGSEMKASNGTPLICIPKTAFKKLPPEVEESVNVADAVSKLPLPSNWEETRRKLHS